MKRLLYLILCACSTLNAQKNDISIQITHNGKTPAYTNIFLKDHDSTILNPADHTFRLQITHSSLVPLTIECPGYLTIDTILQITPEQVHYVIPMSAIQDLDDVVISGNMKAVSKMDSPIPIEVYNAAFFKRNKQATIFEGLQQINGVRPQVNCNVCNTGDIHINGLEGPYTMILLDGMPIVSGLSTVYGLQGIPQSMIERVEVVKGPASTLYGSEAVGGLINIITKSASNMPSLTLDAHTNSWLEHNIDLGYKHNWNQQVNTFLGINYFNYSHPKDNNNDNFTDLTLQHRLAIFNKWEISTKHHPITFMARFLTENRWGGEIQWKPIHRGGTEVYGESIHTNRYEMIGSYRLPTKADIRLNLSYNHHMQDAAYGNTAYIADQKVAFAQVVHHRNIKKHSLLMGATYRYTYYDDNTAATIQEHHNQPAHSHLPGWFLQDEWKIQPKHTVLYGLRYDYNAVHGSIWSPRINYKWNNIDKTHTLRLGVGNGYRVVNVFTEDHAALSGARDVVFMNALKPEQSWNFNANWVSKIFPFNGSVINIDATAFYTYFTNKIIADYDADPDLIIYDNLQGHSISKGVSMNIDYQSMSGFKALIGATLMDVYSVSDYTRTRQLFTERFTGTWSLSYEWNKWTYDYTGNVYSPMRLPLLHELDPRPAYAPWWSLQHIQAYYKWNEKIEIYGGIKNVWNWTPSRHTDMMIARSFDPFDRGVAFDADGRVIPTLDNPYGLQFDPSYVYAANQGRRIFLGFKIQLN